MIQDLESVTYVIIIVKLYLQIPTYKTTQNICITFIQRRSNVFYVGPTLYKCYTHVIQMLYKCVFWVSLKRTSHISHINILNLNPRVLRYQIEHEHVIVVILIYVHLFKTMFTFIYISSKVIGLTFYLFHVN